MAGISSPAWIYQFLIESFLSVKHPSVRAVIADHEQKLGRHVSTRKLQVPATSKRFRQLNDKNVILLINLGKWRRNEGSPPFGSIFLSPPRRLSPEYIKNPPGRRRQVKFQALSYYNQRGELRARYE